MKIPSPRILLTALLAFGTPCAHAAWDCPEDLKPVAGEYRRTLQEKEYAVRDSTADKPVRVEPTSIFDLAAHECHTGRAQTYRIYGPGECAPFDKPGIYAVRYPYVLYYRREKTEDAMFKENWKEGTDGFWQATFEKKPEGWTGVGQREVLDLKGGGDRRK